MEYMDTYMRNPFDYDDGDAITSEEEQYDDVSEMQWEHDRGLYSLRIQQGYDPMYLLYEQPARHFEVNLSTMFL